MDAIAAVSAGGCVDELGRRVRTRSRQRVRGRARPSDEPSTIDRSRERENDEVSASRPGVDDQNRSAISVRGADRREQRKMNVLPSARARRAAGDERPMPISSRSGAARAMQEAGVGEVVVTASRRRPRLAVTACVTRDRRRPRGSSDRARRAARLL